MLLLVLGLLGMNLCLAKSLADVKETTIVDVITEPVRQATDKVITTTKDMAHKAVDSIIATSIVCKTAVCKAVSDIKLGFISRCRAVEANVVKHTVIYKDMQTTNDELLAQISELQAKVDAITDNKATLEKKVVNRPKNAKKPVRARA